jgi:hypothetical protein
LDDWGKQAAAERVARGRRGIFDDEGKQARRYGR